MPTKNPFQLLEINLISAQDLAPATKSMRTFAVAWIRPERKLTTRIDEDGHTNPAWNDKFIFRVNNEFLVSENAALMIELYASTWLRDLRIGTVRVLLSNLLPPPAAQKFHMRFVALQIRRPSGRPQGILNIGVSLLDSTTHSMPLCSEISSTVDYGDDSMVNVKAIKQQDHKEEIDKKQIHKHLRRTKSEMSEPASKDKIPPYASPICTNSTFNNGGSVINRSELSAPTKVTVAVTNGSIVSDVGPSASVVAAAIAKGIYPNGHGNGNVNGNGNNIGNNNSEVASSIVEDWTVESASVEGLKSKLERWKTELPPLYDNGNQKIKSTRGGHTRRHTDGGGDGNGSGGGRLFSCFGNAYGCEFTIVCGANNNARKKSGKVHVSPSDDVSAL